MGVVIKQSFWGTVVAYMGVVVGYFNTLYLRAEYFTLEQIGLFTLITANAMMISPISSFGAGSTYVKFFPSFAEDKKHRLFTFLFLVSLLGNLIILGLGFLLQDTIAARYVENTPTYIDYLFVTGIVIFSNSMFDLFFNYSRTILKVVFPSFLRDVYLRLASLLLVLGYSLDWWTFDWAVIGLGVVYFLSFVFLFLNLIFVHGFRFDFRIDIISSAWKINLLKFGSYSMLLAGSFAVINNISYEQITVALGSKMNGIFTTCFFIGVVVEMPKRNMAKIMMPIISKASTAKDYKTIGGIYKRGSITMSVIGVLLAIGIVTNLNDLFDFIPKGKDFETGFWVVIFVCLAKVALMVSSFAGEIINYSVKYQFNLYFQLLSALVLIGLNYLLIPIIGINGAGLSYMVAIFFHIVLKGIFVHRQYGFLPFDRSHFALLIISLIVFFIAYLLPLNFHPILNIALRGVLTTILYILLVYRFKISPDINSLIRSTFARLSKNSFK
ncbi:MAG: polysaccharide biosynthesis C-terminal domain-containing protein [Bacteroidota bacterium]